MATSRDIAAQILPHFAEAVLERRPMAYGYFARQINRDVATESIVIGQAMHLIGALCVFRQIPVAPLYYAKRTDGENRAIFTSDPVEFVRVLPHFETLYVAAREYKFSESDFTGISEKLHDVLLQRAPPDWSPHYLWHMAVWKCPPNSEQTYFERALQKYESIIAELRKQRKGGG